MIGGRLNNTGQVTITCGDCGKRTTHEKKEDIKKDIICECGNVLVIVGGEKK
jgi:hypothetical protein